MGEYLELSATGAAALGGVDLAIAIADIVVSQNLRYYGDDTLIAYAS